MLDNAYAAGVRDAAARLANAARMFANAVELDEVAGSHDEHTVAVVLRQASDVRLLADTVVCHLVKWADDYALDGAHEAVHADQWGGMAQPDRLGEL